MKSKTTHNYKCLMCGKQKELNFSRSDCVNFCLDCGYRTNHKLFEGQQITDYKTLKQDFELVLEEFRNLTTKLNYNLRKIEDLQELVTQAKGLRERIEIHHKDLVHSLNEQVIKND
jgi:DNA-directed RNA polymerase subunit RPC12/RpoP